MVSTTVMLTLPKSKNVTTIELEGKNFSRSEQGAMNL